MEITGEGPMEEIVKVAHSNEVGHMFQFKSDAHSN